MSLPSVVIETARQLFSPAQLSFASRFERQARADRSFFLVMAQMFQSSVAVSMASRSLQALGRSPLRSFHTKVALFISPALYLVEQQLPLGKVKTAARFLQRNLGTLFYTAAFISQIALAYLTGSGAAIAAVALLAFDCLHTAGLVPSRISQIYCSTQLPVLISLQGLIRGTLVKIALFGAAILLEKFIMSKLALPPDPQKNTGVLTPEFLDTVLKADDPSALFEINLNHLGWIKAKPTPNLHLDEFLTEWDRINWAQHLPALRQTIDFQLPADLRRRFSETIEELKIDHPILTQLTQVQKREAKIVLKAIQTELSEERRAKILFKVAIFGVGFLSKFHDRFLFDVNSKTPLRDEILTSSLAAEVALNIPKELVGMAQALGFSHLFRAFPLEVRFAYDVKSVALKARFIPRFEEKARSWWKCFLAQKDSQTQAQFQALLREAVDRESRVNWNIIMENRSKLSIRWNERQILQVQNPLPANANLDALDLAKTASRRPRSLRHASSVELSIDVSDVLILAMLFEMGIIQRKTAQPNPPAVPARQLPRLSERLVTRLQRVANPPVPPHAQASAAR